MVLLEKLGFDVHFRDKYWNAPINAGYEFTEIHPDTDEFELKRTVSIAPNIIKDPRLCFTLDRLLKMKLFKVKLLIIPVREQKQCALSRVKNEIQWTGEDLDQGSKEELCLSEKGADQITFNQKCLASLTTTAVLHDIPILHLAFPRFVQDPVYLFKKLENTHLEVEWSMFMNAFRQVVQKDKVHKY